MTHTKTHLKPWFVICNETENEGRLYHHDSTALSEDEAWILFACDENDAHWTDLKKALGNDTQGIVAAVKDRGKFHGYYCVKVIRESEEVL